MHEYMSQSLDTAASGAAKLIQLASQTRPDVIGNTQPAVPVHVHWAPFHCFSAAMFFSFQLIANPEQPGANLFRSNIARVLDILSLSKGVPVADRAMNILTALAPLYDVSYGSKSAPEREKTKHQVLSLVKTLAFPYQDSLESARAQGKPSGMGKCPLISVFSLFVSCWFLGTEKKLFLLPFFSLRLFLMDVTRCVRIQTTDTHTPVLGLYHPT